VNAVSAGTTSITGTSEGVTGSASLTVTSPPPPGAGEPMLQSTDFVLYSEDFEKYANLTALLTYDWNLQEYSYSGQENMTFPSPLGGHASAKSFRITYPVSPTYQDQDAIIVANGFPMPSSNTAQFSVIEAWIRTNAGYPCRRQNASDQNGAGEKTLIWNQSASSTPRFVLGCGDPPCCRGQYFGGQYDAAFPSAGGFVLSLDGPVGGTGTAWYFQNMNAATRPVVGYYNDGNWHLLKMKLTPGTFQNSTGGDGSIEMWMDGVKIMEYIGSDPTRPEYRQVLVPTTVAGQWKNLSIGGPFNGGPSPAQGPQSKDYDDVKVWVRP
jgi:hypothetical protein